MLIRPFSISDSTFHITQIAAVYQSHYLSLYVVPKQKMTTKASEITGVTIVGDTMLVQKKEVQAVPNRTALGEFLAFLKKCH